MRSLLCSLLITLVASGCASLSRGGGRVAEVHLFGSPVTLNLDNRPGADGFAGHVYVVKVGESKGSPVQTGKIEVLMFDGLASVDEVFTKTPAQTWTFTPRQLNAV